VRTLRHLFLLLAFSLMALPALAQAADSDSAFTVTSIHLDGLKRVPKSTVMRVLPVKVGSRMTESLSEKVIERLYHTGFFNGIDLSHDGGRLIISFSERPMIAVIHITGNKEITGTKLKPVLDSLNIKIGETYYPSKLNEIVRGLEQQYNAIGFHGVTIEPVVKKEPRNRVSINIHIHEGKVSKLWHLKIEGNHAFSAFTIRRQMGLSRKNIISWFTHSDRFSEERLGDDMKAIDTFYRNHGFVRFHFTKRDITRGPNGVSVVLGVSEGEKYKVGKVDITGNTLHQKEALMGLLRIKTGEIFTLRGMKATSDLINGYFGNNGFAYPNIHPITVIDDSNHTVNITFDIKPGSKVYVRYINFTGNTRTADAVLRREMRQLESSLYSSVQINRSKERLNLLGFFKSVDVSSRPVPGHKDMVDLDVKVEEMRTGKAQVQAGYDNEHGFLYGANITEPNFMGTGNALSFGFQNSLVDQNYSISFTNPYYLPSGVSRGMSVFYSKVSNQGSYNLDSSYHQDGYGANVSYGFPITEHDRLSFGYGYERVNIKGLQTTGIQAAVPSVRDFMTPTGESDPRTKESFDDVKLMFGWSYNSLDRAIFPTRGISSSAGLEVSLPVFGSSANYYLGTYDMQWYKPLGKGFIVKFHSLIGYGQGYDNDVVAGNRLPFFKNFYAGGISSLPGYEANTLGPYNLAGGTGIGGNLETIFGLDLIVPNPISDRVRTAVILGAGNIFQSKVYQPDADDANLANVNSFSFKRLRTAGGVMVSWYSPMGMISVSLAWPLTHHANDQTQAIGFTFGGTF